MVVSVTWDLPPAEDSSRFPGYRCCSNNHRWCEAEIARGLVASQWYRLQWQQWQEDKQYLLWVKEVWSQLMYINGTITTPLERRIALDKLRTLLGLQAYYSGNLPPPFILRR